MDLKTQLETVAKNHQASIQNLETKFDKLANKHSGRPSGLLPSNTQPNPRGSNSKAYKPPQSRNEHVNAVFIRSGKSYDPPDNPNDQQNNSENPINFDSNDEEYEPTPQLKTQLLKPIKETPLPKPYKPKIPYPQRLRKEKMEAQYGKFLDMIRVVRINVPLIDVLAGMPNYGKFLKEFISNKPKIKQISAAFLSDESSAMIQNKVPLKLRDPGSFLISYSFNKTFSCNALADLGASINLMPYSLYAKHLPVIISSKLSTQNKSKLVSVLKKHKEAFAWKTTDIPGICPSFCKHKIQLLDDKKPVVQKQRRLNPNMQKVVKKEIVKLLDIGIIYLIADSLWVSPIQCVPKKGGITVVINENDELFPTRTITSWRVCIDYYKLNEATAKDHFPLPFMDQMLERLAENKYFSFLDATFQRCMLAIFYDMIEESVEVFMDDFSVFGNSFEKCLNNLDKMLQHCKDAHLVLNWKKRHFMVKEGIVLGHKVYSAGLEFDKAKINVISKLPHPTNIKGVRSFLGHAGFYRRFIKDFSKIARPLTKLLEKDTPFEFNDECQKAFELLKEKLTCAPVIKLFCHFGMPKALINDRGTHFCNKMMEKTMKRYGVNHRFSTSYHPQTSGKVENMNRALKRILEKTVKDNPAIWSRKLDDALWAFRTTYKTPTGTTPYKLIYGKNYHLPFEIEHHTY
ncbi:reverse transcriptase domain-containing protein [Tanacetum coccineum]